MESSTRDVQDNGQDPQRCPGQHKVTHVKLARVHPSPDECPNAARDNPDNPVKCAAILKLLDQYDDKANEGC
jgi:hypothetical protein